MGGVGCHLDIRPATLPDSFSSGNRIVSKLVNDRGKTSVDSWLGFKVQGRESRISFKVSSRIAHKLPHLISSQVKQEACCEHAGHTEGGNSRSDAGLVLNF